MSYFDDASLVMIPSGYKTSKVYSVKPTDGSGDLAFTRSNDTATRVASSGLIEKVRTNLQTYSQDFSNAVWVKSAGATLTHSQTDPNGGTTASRLQMPSGTSNYLAASAITGLTNGGQYTHSVYMKSNTGSTQSVRIIDGVRGAAGGTLLASVTTSWQRFEVVITTASTSAGLQIDNVSGAYNNDILIAFAQTEVSDFGATPYIATTTAAVSVGPVANVPRLDYLNSSCPRLLLEPQRTNLVFFSEQLNNAGWAASAVVTANTAVSPDGYTNADSVMESATTDYQIIGDPVTTTSGTAYTFSFFAKPNGRNFARVLFGNGSFPDNQSAYFNLLTGATSATASITASMVSYGNGWYRCIATMTSDANASDAAYFGPARNMTDGYTPYAGNASLGIYAWGVQQEAGAYATSYIPTLGASVTRGADAASKTGISSLIGQTEGTIFGEMYTNPSGTESLLTWLRNGTAGLYGNFIFLGTNSSAQSRVQVVQGGIQQVEILGSALAVGWHKFALAYKLNDFAFYVDGVQIDTASSGTIPTGMNELFIDEYIDGGIRNASKNQALLFKTRLTNAQLAELTTI
jgi:hypothetical protein